MGSPRVLSQPIVPGICFALVTAAGHSLLSSQPYPWISRSQVTPLFTPSWLPIRGRIQVPELARPWHLSQPSFSWAASLGPLQVLSTTGSPAPFSMLAPCTWTPLILTSCDFLDLFLVSQYPYSMASGINLSASRSQTSSRSLWSVT